MKVNMHPETKAYKEFELAITVESEEEAAELYALFNHTQIVSILGNIDSSEIKKAVRKGNGRTPPYEQKHAELCISL